MSRSQSRLRHLNSGVSPQMPPYNLVFKFPGQKIDVKGHSVAEREVLIAIWDNTGEGTRLTSPTASKWGPHSRGKHFTNVPGVLWQKISHCLCLIYPLQRGDSSSIPVSMRKAWQGTLHSPRGNLQAFKWASWWICRRELNWSWTSYLCPSLSQLLRPWLCNLINILSTFLAYFYKKALYMNLDGGSQKHLMKFKQDFFDLW